jgi:transposase
MAIADSNGIPIACCIDSASPHEIKLVEKTLDSNFVNQFPEKVIGDKAYDSDPLDNKLLEERKIELIAPHRGNRRKSKTQDGRKLRRYCRRWKIERLFAWLGNFRRIVVRYEHNYENFLSFVLLGVIIILTRQF